MRKNISQTLLLPSACFGFGFVCCFVKAEFSSNRKETEMRDNWKPGKVRDNNTLSFQVFRGKWVTDLGYFGITVNSLLRVIKYRADTWRLDLKEEEQG